MASMVNLFNKFLTLPRNQKILYLKAYGILWMSRFAVAFLNPRTLLRLVNKPFTETDLDPDRLARIQLLNGTILRASQLVPNTTCLSRAVAARILLAREGYRSTIRIAVSRSGGALEAHAWVECEGKVLVGERCSGDHQWSALGPVADSSSSS